MAGKDRATSGAKTAKNAAARALAAKHFELENGIIHIFRVQSEAESAGAKSEPIKLLEVNENTVPTGIMPLHFGPTEAFQYSSVIIEITPIEFERIKSDKLKLPMGWAIGEEFPRPGNAVGAR